MMNRDEMNHKFIETMKDALYICQSMFAQSIQRCEDLEMNPQIPLVIMKQLVEKNLEHF